MRNIFITGVSSGLGYGLAKVFLEQGAIVYGVSRRTPEGLMDLGLRHRCVDLRQEDVGREIVSNMVVEIDSFDVVLLNAGKLGQISDMGATPLADIRDTMEVNVFSNKWLLDVLFSNSRSIAQVVGISSGASRSGSRGWNGYSLSKATFNMLIKLYAGEQLNTHFTSLAPGLIDTAMQDYLTALPADARYAPLEILKSAKGTEAMPDGYGCAQKLIQILPDLLEKESGCYADIRNL
ncbi:MAG: SDR family NAD(P)-dependent oxidoreductase [Verrucomicrobiota bacterium]|nr:SDR family NAD(P)-dependent oxidoreductase [Verrucomicrobiota bacterium]